MSKIDRAEDCAMTNLKGVLSIALASATLATVFPFFAGGFLLLLQPGFAPLVAQFGLTPGAGPAWFVPVSVFSAIGLAAGSFNVSRKQKSFVVAGLLAASGIMLMIPAIIATGNLGFIFPGPLIGVIIGLGIFGLAVAKGVSTTRAVRAAPRFLREVKQHE
jgi:hypothetical protein